MSSGGFVSGALKRAWSKIMDRIGGRLVSGMADTSSDAPNARFAPKRDVYRHMEEEKAQKKGGGGHDHRH